MLNNKVGIIVPSKIGHEEVDNSSIKESVLKRFSKEFGGASAIKQEGAWLSDTDGLVIEDSILVYAYVSDIEAAARIVREVAVYIAKIMQQEAVLVELNNRVEFITEETVL